MSFYKLSNPKTYVSASSRKQSHSQQSPTVIINKINPKSLKTHHPSHTQYSLLDKLNLQKDILQRQASSQSSEDQLKILDQQQSSLQNSFHQSNDHDQEEYQQQQYTSNHLSQQSATVFQSDEKKLHPLQKKRLQIIRKLQQQDICSPEQYQGIVAKLIKQNQTLQSDLQLLRQKVDLLKLKQLRKNRERVKMESQNKYHPQEQYRKLKTTLANKYKQLQKLQKKSTKSSTSFALQIQYRQFINKLIQLQNSCQHYRSSLKDQKKVSKSLKNQLKKYNGIKLSSTRSKQSQQLQTYNKQLKTKIFLMKKILSNQAQSQLEVHQFNIQMKQRQKKTAELMKYQLVKKKLTQRQKIMQKTRLATIGGGQIQKLQTVNGTINFRTMDSKVRARTQFSFQNNNDFDQSLKTFTPLKRNNNSALTQLANENPKSMKKSITQKSSLQQQNPPPAIQFTPLTNQQITSLNNLIKHQTKDIQNLSLNLQKRLSFLQDQLNPNFKRQNSPHLFSKQKDMIITKNRILIKEMKYFYDRKIQLLREYNIVQKYYGPEENNKEQQINKEKRMQYNNHHNTIQLSHRQSNSTRQLTFPRITNNDFNRSRSQMKFVKVHSEQKVQKMRRTVLSTGKSLKNNSDKPTEIIIDRKTKKSPSMPTYNNGRSQPSIKKEQEQLDKQQQSQQIDKKHQTKAQNQLIKQQVKPQPIQCSQNGIQTQLSSSLLVHELLSDKKLSNISRQQFIGQIQLDNCHFDDRFYSRIINSKMYINQLIVYHNQKGIIFVKAKYKPSSGHINLGKNHNNNDQDFVSTQLSFKLPSQHLSQSLNHPSTIQSSTDLSINDYIKQIKLFYNTTEGYVSKLQIISKYNVKYQFGNKQLIFPTLVSPYLNLNIKGQKNIKQKQQRKKSKPKQYQEQQFTKPIECHKFYQFDIKPNQYPTFMFGNYIEITTNQSQQLMLTGLGFVIQKEQQSQ